MARSRGAGRGGLLVEGGSRLLLAALYFAAGSPPLRPNGSVSGVSSLGSLAFEEFAVGSADEGEADGGVEEDEEVVLDEAEDRHLGAVFREEFGP